MIIVRYSHDGTKLVAVTDATRRSLGQLARIKERQGWNVSYLDPQTILIRDDVACGHVYKLRPNNWPLTNGEPA